STGRERQGVPKEQPLRQRVRPSDPLLREHSCWHGSCSLCDSGTASDTPLSFLRQILRQDRSPAQPLEVSMRTNQEQPPTHRPVSPLWVHLHRLALIASLCLGDAAIGHADLYEWTDAQGTLHLGNDASEAPAGTRTSIGGAS